MIGDLPARERRIDVGHARAREVLADAVGGGRFAGGGVDHHEAFACALAQPVLAEDHLLDLRRAGDAQAVARAQAAQGRGRAARGVVPEGH